MTFQVLNSKTHMPVPKSEAEAPICFADGTWELQPVKEATFLLSEDGALYVLYRNESDAGCFDEVAETGEFIIQFEDGKEVTY